MASLHTAARAVRFQDIDAAGIVFFARVFDYFHDALFEHYTARGMNMADVIRDASWILPIVHCEADYRAPMRFGDALAVEIERAELGRSSVTVHYVVRSASDASKVHCVGKMVSACIDRATFKPREIPAELRAVFTPA